MGLSKSAQWAKDNPERWAEHQLRYRTKNRKPCPCGSPRPKQKVFCDTCRVTRRAHQLRTRRLKNRLKVYTHKEAIGCSECGYTKCGAALDWHHTKDDKERRLTIRSYFTKLGERERDKCVLLCSNCHRELHSKNGDI